MATNVLASPRDVPIYVRSIYDKHDFTSFQFNQSEFESYNREVEVLKVEVKLELMDSTIDPVEKVILIDLLCRLGISYHFENDIEEQIKHIHETQAINFYEYRPDNLYAAATVFRTLRQHGYKVSSDLFIKFKNSDGTFKESNVEGLLALYEASYLSTHGEDILDEAAEYTKTRLESLASQQTPHLAQHISNALILPYHKGAPRIEARRFISFYEKEDSPNELLLKLAKLDFNRVQLVHKRELSNYSRWHENLFNMKSNFSYSRERIAESYLVGIGLLPDTNYECGRMIVAKGFQLITLLDDTYDVYGTFEELRCFTNAAESWDMAASDMLPDYMKVLYKILLKFCKDFISELKEKDRSSALCEIRNKFTPIFRFLNEEARWQAEGYMPTYDEYMENKTVQNCQRLLLLLCFLRMGEAANSELIEWLRKDQKLVIATERISRLLNDIHSNKVEHEKGTTSAVECYANEHGFSNERAIKDLRQKISDEWKNINEACMRPTALPMKFIRIIVNFLRTAEEVYKQDNGFSNSCSLRDIITSLMIDKILL